MDDDRLKQGYVLFAKDYFDELLERTREIRASKRRFYRENIGNHSQATGRTGIPEIQSKTR